MTVDGWQQWRTRSTPAWVAPRRAGSYESGSPPSGTTLIRRSSATERVRAPLAVRYERADAIIAVRDPHELHACVDAHTRLRVIPGMGDAF
ncbi:MAG: hypothetical protein FJW88_11245 [Actinobacteria bacterium]|nr:hypothetical protein [Actinomycetota bacterium]